MIKNKKNESTNIIKISLFLIIGIVFIISIILAGVFSSQKSYAYSGTETVEGTILFEDIGQYAFAAAGSNLASRGNSHSDAYATAQLITNYPSNWDTIKQKIPSDIQTRINNMTGSYLDYDGKAKLGVLSVMIYPSTTKDVLVIYPDGSYNVYNGVYNNKNPEIEIKGKGWYYVSILNSERYPQQAWGITTIYENNNLTNNYIQLVRYGSHINGNLSATTTNAKQMFLKAKYDQKDFINIYGLLTGAGNAAWPVYTGDNTTQDRAWAILEDDSLYQLYDKGDGHFTGRTATDFANNIYTSQRSTNIQGGELDIFEEKLDKSYFGGKTIKGLKFQKDGTNAYGIDLIGISVEVTEAKAKKDYAADSAINYGDNVKKGDIIKYSIQYTNSNSSSNAEVTITDTISAGLEYVTSSASLGEPKVTKNNDGSTTLVWNTNLEKSSSGTLKYSVKVADDSYLTVNNSAIIRIGDTEYKQEPLINPIPKKEYASDTPAGINSGVVTTDDIIKYNIKYANVKKGKQNIVITDVLSKGLTYVPKSSNLGEPKITKNTDGSTTLVWNTSLDASSNGTLTYSVKVGSGISLVNNSASIKMGDDPSYRLNELTNPVTTSEVFKTPNTASPLIVTSIIFGSLFLIIAVYFVLKQFGINPLHKRF